MKIGFADPQLGDRMVLLIHRGGIFGAATI
jgi:hypothetical protein